jgi:hypothetical protein
MRLGAINPVKRKMPLLFWAQASSRAEEDFMVRISGRNLITGVALFWSIFATTFVETAQAASMTIPAGTTVTVRMAESVDSETSHAGQIVRATVDTPVMINGHVAVPQGAEAIGRITAIESPGRFRGRAVVAMELTALNFDGKSMSVMTSAYQEVGNPRGKQTTKYVGGGGVLGTLLGAFTGGKKGAFIGMTVGAAGGAVAQVVRGRDPLTIPAESLVLFTLQSPLTVEAEY